MANASDIASGILGQKENQPQQSMAHAFAPSNIALIKYWGKRDSTLNLPHTNSLSISLGHIGSTTHITSGKSFAVTLNHQQMPSESALTQGISHYLDMLGLNKNKLAIDINMNIPMAAGLASSACGYASLIQALNALYQWQLSRIELSILARLGSGSACRSLWQGFVEWQKGDDPVGWDSHGVALTPHWHELRVGLIIVSTEKKHISSRLAMQRTVDESILYQSWQQQIAHDLPRLKKALQQKDFTHMGELAEANACAMHATMLAARPAIVYSNAKSKATILKIKSMRNNGINCYFTQDAGPNIKALFLQKNEEDLLQHFPKMVVIKPFEKKP
jgi:diphosphomevalonate decarboxylase